MFGPVDFDPVMDDDDLLAEQSFAQEALSDKEFEELMEKYCYAETFDEL